MNRLLVFPLFFFLFIFLSIPGYAYYDIDITQNVSLSGYNYRALRCLNQTDNEVYCYAIGEDYFVRFNATLQDAKTCQNNVSFAPYGGAVINETTACIVYGAYTDCFNITNIASGGSCPLVYQYSNIKSTGGASPVVGETYGYLTYWTGQNGIRNGNDLVSSAFYPQNIYFPYEDAGQTSIPYKDTNATLYYTYTYDPYGLTEQVTEIYNNGAYVSTTSSISDLWGLPVLSGFPKYTDIIDVDGTQYMYILQERVSASHGTDTDTIWRVNFENVVNITAPNFYATNPLNNSVVLATGDTYQLRLYLLTDKPGLLTFSHNDSSNLFLIINESNMDSKYYTMDVPVADSDGLNFWYAWFIDNTSTQWTFASYPIYYTVQTQLTPGDLASNPAEALALAFASIFSIRDLATAKMMFSVVMAFAMSFMTLIFLHKLKVHGDINGQAFMVSLLLWIVMFSLVGWFPSWLLVVIIVIAGFVMARNLGIGG